MDFNLIWLQFSYKMVTVMLPYDKSTPLFTEECIDRRKSPGGTFPPKNPHYPHSLAAMPPTRTVVRIEVFFGVAKPHQKSYLNISRFTGKNILFEKLSTPLFTEECNLITQI